MAFNNGQAMGCPNLIALPEESSFGEDAARAMGCCIAEERVGSGRVVDPEMVLDDWKRVGEA